MNRLTQASTDRDVPTARPEFQNAQALDVGLSLLSVNEEGSRPVLIKTKSGPVNPIRPTRLLECLGEVLTEFMA